MKPGAVQKWTLKHMNPDMILNHMLPVDFMDCPVIYSAIALSGLIVLLHLLNSSFGDTDPLGRTFAILGLCFQYILIFIFSFQASFSIMEYVIFSTYD